MFATLMGAICTSQWHEQLGFKILNVLNAKTIAIYALLTGKKEAAYKVSLPPCDMPSFSNKIFQVEYFNSQSATKPYVTWILLKKIFNLIVLFLSWLVSPEHIIAD